MGTAASNVRGNTDGARTQHMLFVADNDNNNNNNKNNNVSFATTQRRAPLQGKKSAG